MKAVRLLEYGGQLVFNDVPTPTIPLPGGSRVLNSDPRSCNFPRELDSIRGNSQPSQITWS